MNNKNTIIQCINLKKSYQDGDIIYNILNGISFELYKGDIIAIIGKSGSGKSTLLHLIGGLDKPTSGEVLFENKSLNCMSFNQISQLRNLKLGFIYQFHHLLLDFTALENVAIPFMISKKNKKEAEYQSYLMLKKVNLENKIHKYPSQLSGGERQRVAIARAFINKPSLVIADEPTGNLDQYNANIILNLILRLNIDYHTSFLIATHDISIIKKISNIFQMKNGKLLNNKR